MVLNASEVNGMFIRPGVVYGRGGGLTGLWFDGASKIETSGQWRKLHRILDIFSGAPYNFPNFGANL
jgi:hypothetical protein